MLNFLIEFDLISMIHHTLILFSIWLIFRNNWFKMFGNGSRQSSWNPPLGSSEVTALCIFLMCSIKSTLAVKESSHWSHLKVKPEFWLRSLWTFLMWIFNSLFVVNKLSHCSHLTIIKDLDTASKWLYQHSNAVNYKCLLQNIYKASSLGDGTSYVS